MNKIGSKIISVLWYLGAALEFISIPIFLAAIYDISITYEWFDKLRNYEYIEMLYYIIAAISMFIFSILALVSRNRKQDIEMLIAMFCFIGQTIGIAIVLISQYNWVFTLG